MNKWLRKIITEFDLRGQAEELGVSVWQTPSFLFILMGLIIVSAMTGVYFISRVYDAPEVLILSESLVVIFLLTIGNSIIRDIEQIARANKMKTEFISIASHQLKTPLSEISWEIELLLAKNQAGMNEKQISIVNDISHSNIRMKKLVNDLLDVSRIDQGRLVLIKENFNLLDSIREIVEENKFLALARAIKIETVINGKIPTLIGDRRRIGVVIENIFSNAIKYIGQKGRIIISVSKKDNFIIVEIKDNGVGIPLKQQDKIFQKFFRSDNVAKYNTDGTGLGLYIAKSIVEQGGGKIWFDSEENVGTKFSFSIPILKAE